jgi:inner membrane protein YidH
VTSNPYERFRSSDLILRDELAVDRTALANERTLLSYVRTGLAFGVTGAGTIKFFASLISQLLGWCMVVLAVFVVALGIWRFRRVAGHVSTCRKPPLGAAEQSAGGDAENRAPQP